MACRPILISVDLGQFRDALKGEQIAGRIEGHKLVPYATRADIDVQGCRMRRYCFMPTIRLPCSSCTSRARGGLPSTTAPSARVGYAGKNGRPYTAIGRTLISRGALTKENVSMPAIRPG